MTFGNNGNGHEIGQAYFKPALKRAVNRARAKLDKACDRLLEDAAGETEVVGPKGFVMEISPKDRRQAFECIRDTLDEAPTAANAGPQIVFYNAARGADPKWPDEITRLLAKELESERPEPVDVDDTVPTNGHGPDDEDE